MKSAWKNALLSALGPDAHVVGGAVRDRLLGKDTVDLDVVVGGDAGRAAARVEKLIGGRAFPLHVELGIFRVVGDGGYVDVAQIQGKTLGEDLDRRDFTVNALAVPIADWFRPAWKKAIVDRHHGLADVKARRLRAVSGGVFRDDPLRLLRLFRLSAEHELSISPDTMKLVRRDRARAAKPAAERQREEFLKMFATPRAYPALVAMDKAGVLDVLFPPAAPLRRTAPRYYGRGGVLLHTLNSVKCFEEIVATLPAWFPRVHGKIRAYLNEPIAAHPRLAHCKWGLLLHDIGKPKTAKMIEGRLRFFEHEHVGADMVADLGPRYRWSTDETQRYARLVRNHMRPGNLATHPDLSDKAVNRFFRDLEDDGIAMLLVSLADHLTYLTPAQRRRRSSAHERVTLDMIQRFYRNRKKILPDRIVNGNDIMRAFKLKPSRLIGKLLSDAHDAQMDGQVRSRDEAIAFLRPIVAALTPAEREGNL